MFENSMRMQILEPKMEQVTRRWKKFHDEERPGFVFQIKQNRGHEIKEDETGTACGTYGTHKINTRFSWDNLKKERDHLEDIGIDEMIILKWILKKLDGMA